MAPRGAPRRADSKTTTKSNRAAVVQFMSHVHNTSLGSAVRVRPSASVSPGRRTALADVTSACNVELPARAAQKKKKPLKARKIFVFLCGIPGKGELTVAAKRGQSDPTMAQKAGKKGRVSECANTLLAIRYSITQRSDLGGVAASRAFNERQAPRSRRPVSHPPRLLSGRGTQSNYQPK